MKGFFFCLFKAGGWGWVREMVSPKWVVIIVI